MIRLPVRGFAREAIVSAVACAAYAEEHGDGDASSVRALATAFDGGSLVFGDGSEVETIARYVEDMAGEEYTLATQAQRCGDAEAARDGCLVGRRLRDLAAKVLRLGHALRARRAAERDALPRCGSRKECPSDPYRYELGSCPGAVVALCRGTTCYQCEEHAAMARRAGVLLDDARVTR